MIKNLNLSELVISGNNIFKGLIPVDTIDSRPKIFLPRLEVLREGESEIYVPG